MASGPKLPRASAAACREARQRGRQAGNQHGHRLGGNFGRGGTNLPQRPGADLRQCCVVALQQSRSARARQRRRPVRFGPRHRQWRGRRGLVLLEGLSNTLSSSGTAALAAGPILARASTASPETRGSWSSIRLGQGRRWPGRPPGQSGPEHIRRPPAAWICGPARISRRTTNFGTAGPRRRPGVQGAADRRLIGVLQRLLPDGQHDFRGRRQRGQRPGGRRADQRIRVLQPGDQLLRGLRGEAPCLPDARGPRPTGSAVLSILSSLLALARIVASASGGILAERPRA